MKQLYAESIVKGLQIRRFNSAMLSFRAITRFGLAFCLMISVGVLTAQQSFAQQHRATIIGADGKELVRKLDANGNVLQSEGVSVAPQDSLALVALYHAQHGDTWVDNSGWLTEMVEFWVGVDRVENVGTDEEPEWRVTRINPPRNNMTRPGPIPPEIEMLSELRYYNYDVNLQSGKIPEEFGNIEPFERFQCRNNLFTGEFPWDAFGALRNFSRLQVRSNFHVGELPQSGTDAEGHMIFPVINLIMIDNNRFTGHLPAWFADRPTMNSMLLDRNLFTGPIPDYSALADYSGGFRLNNMNLDPGPIPNWLLAWSDNRVSGFNLVDTNREGVIPDWFGQMDMTRLDGIGGQDNIGGVIPENMKFMVNLERFRLEEGNWTGEMPRWLAEMPSLMWIEFPGVNFTGTLPAEFAQMENFTRFRMSDNSIEGGIPEIWQTSTRIDQFEISYSPGIKEGRPTPVNYVPDEFEHNFEVGPIPVWIASSWTSLDRLTLSNVHASGEIPETWGELGLGTLNLSHNPDLVGELPMWMEDANMGTLNISHTGIDVGGEIPAFLQNWNALGSLGLAGLGIEGPIPEWFGDAPFQHRLATLDLSDNNLTGPIPENFGNFFNMGTLDLSNNQLSGDLPASFADIGRFMEGENKLSTLRIYGNEGLTGELPLALAQEAHFMRNLEYDGTGICEPVDPAFEAWLAEIERHNNEDYYPPRTWLISRTNVPCDNGVDAEPVDRMHTFRLDQNYPNPFNPSTTISYEVPADAGLVMLQVYNVIGQRVATLVNEQQTAGSYQVNFDAGQLASGSYIYRLQTGDQVLTRQMMFVK